jgi:hypothetical protein
MIVGQVAINKQAVQKLSLQMVEPGHRLKPVGADKPISWAKPAPFDFSTTNFTVWSHILSTTGADALRWTSGSLPVALLDQKKQEDSPKLHLVPVFVIDPLHPSPPHVKHYYTLNTYSETAAYTSDLQKMGGMPGTNTQTRTPWWNG